MIVADFYPRPPRGGRQRPGPHSSVRCRFLSTPSARRATSSPTPCATASIFLSTPSARRATSLVRLYCSIRSDFYPRPPRGGRRLEQCQECIDDSDFYPRPPRGGRPDSLTMGGVAKPFLSTPSARRATRSFELSVKLSDISIHALREEGDDTHQVDVACVIHFYPRPPRGGRLAPRVFKPRAVSISIHALREEGDSKNRDKISIFKQIIQHSARI